MYAWLKTLQSPVRLARLDDALLFSERRDGGGGFVICMEAIWSAEKCAMGIFDGPAVFSRRGLIRAMMLRHALRHATYSVLLCGCRLYFAALPVH